jgi:hypothetical protein
MNMALEFHDSIVRSVRKMGRSLVVSLTAILHESEGDPGIDPGSVWLQPIDITITDAFTKADVTELLNNRLWNGSLSVGPEVHDNLVTVPLRAVAPIELFLRSTNRDFEITGTSAEIRLSGERDYLEIFPGTA